MATTYDTVIGHVSMPKTSKNTIMQSDWTVHLPGARPHVVIHTGAPHSLLQMHQSQQHGMSNVAVPCWQCTVLYS